MDPIYVTGHRNPDTDSIVAAISYAALRNACGDREYEAACLGRVSDETQIVLDRFGFLPPKRITDLYNQVRDLDFDKPPILSGGVTMGRAWDEFQAYPAIASIPVVNEDGTLYGILSRTDIADYNMSRTNSGVLEEVPLFNAISVLEGKILNDAGESTDTISGEVTIALPQSRENLLFHSRESIVLCGNQPDMIRRALELNVSCLVLCQAEISEELRTMPTETCIISTPYDAFRAARLIFQSIPVERICNTQNVVSFHLDDRVDTVRDMVLKYRHPSYPILDGSEKVVGILTRYHLLRPRRKQVVLVDHNEAESAMLLLRGMNPQIIAMDEITQSADADAIREVCCCGVELLATAHARNADELRQRRVFAELLDTGAFKYALSIRGAGSARSYELEELHV